MHGPRRPTRLWRDFGALWVDESGQSLKANVVAVVLAAALVILVSTVLSEAIYVRFIDLFGTGR